MRVQIVSDSGRGYYPINRQSYTYPEPVFSHHMSARIKRNALLLRALYKATPQKQKDILIHASPDLIQALCEIALNLLKGNIPLNPVQYRKLKKQKKIIRLLADKKTGLKRKHHVLKNQTGGFIGAILSAAIPLLASLIGSKAR